MMNRFHRPSRLSHSGFTLFEMLIVVGIFSIVAALGTTSFYTLTSGWKDLRIVADMETAADMAMESIRADVANALSQELSGSPLRGHAGQVEDARTFPPAIHADDTVAIPVQSGYSGGALELGAVVGYRMNRSDGPPRLARSVGVMDGTFPTDDLTYVLPTNVRANGFRVEYLSATEGAAWLTDWSGDALPLAIRVSLSLESIDRLDLQIARKAVFPVYVD